MSDTPRTDAETLKQYQSTGHAMIGRPDTEIPRFVKFSRALERELTAEKERSERLEKALEDLAILYRHATGRDVPLAALRDSNG